MRTGVRYGQAPALFTVPEALELLAAVAGSLDVKGGTRLAAATGECIGYLLETLTRLCNAPAPGAAAWSCFHRLCEAICPKHVHLQPQRSWCQSNTVVPVLVQALCQMRVQ